MNDKMNWLKQFGQYLDRHHLSEAPTGALALLGIALLVLAFKSKQSLLRYTLGFVALASAAAAVWWHYYHR